MNPSELADKVPLGKWAPPALAPYFEDKYWSDGQPEQVIKIWQPHPPGGEAWKTYTFERHPLANAWRRTR